MKLTYIIIFIGFVIGVERGDTDVGYQPIKCLQPCPEDTFMGDWPETTEVEC